MRILMMEKEIRLDIKDFKEAPDSVQDSDTARSAPSSARAHEGFECVLLGVPASVIPTVWACGVSLGLFLCYAIAVALGHTRFLFPMLSECTTTPPEMYIAGITCVYTCGGLAMNVVAMALFIQQLASKPLTARFGWLSASIGLMSVLAFILTGIISTDTSMVLHQLFARAGFFLYLAYGMTIILILRRWLPCEKLDPLSVPFKCAVMAASVSTVVAYIALCYAGQNGDAFHHPTPLVGFSEWMAVWLILAFNLSYRLEFTWIPQEDKVPLESDIATTESSSGE